MKNKDNRRFMKTRRFFERAFVLSILIIFSPLVVIWLFLDKKDWREKNELFKDTFTKDLTPVQKHFYELYKQEMKKKEK